MNPDPILCYFINWSATWTMLATMPRNTKCIPQSRNISDSDSTSHLQITGRPELALDMTWEPSSISPLAIGIVSYSLTAVPLFTLHTLSMTDAEIAHKSCTLAVFLCPTYPFWHWMMQKQKQSKTRQTFVWQARYSEFRVPCLMKPLEIQRDKLVNILFLGLPFQCWASTNNIPLAT